MRSIRWLLVVPAAAALLWHARAALRFGPSVARLALLVALVATIAWAWRLRRPSQGGWLPRTLAAVTVALGFWSAVLELALHRSTLLALDVMALATATVVSAVILLALTRPRSGNPRVVRLLLRAGLVVSVVMVSVTAVEGVLRLTFALNLYEPIPDDARQGSSFVTAEPGRFTPRPNFRGRFVHRQFYGIPVSINAWGLRDDDAAARPPHDGEASVLALGDSFVFGTGVRIEDTFHQRLERRAKEICDRPLIVYNGGVPGYGTWQERRRLDDLADRTHPDVVVLGLLEDNDFQDNWSAVQRASDAPASPHEEPPAEGARSLAAFLDGITRFRFWAVTSSLVQSTPLESILVGSGLVQPLVPTNLFLDQCLRRDPPPMVGEYRDALVEQLEAIRDRCRELDAKLVVLVIPSSIQAEPKRFASFLQLQPADQRDQFDRTAFHRAFVALLEKDGFEVVDTLPALEKAVAAGESGYLREGHWNAHGHAIAADLLAPVLKRLLCR